MFRGMTDLRVRPGSLLRTFAALVLLAAATGCAGKKSTIPPGTAQPDKFLLDRGTEESKEENWLNAREYYRQIVDNYPQSPLRPDAKLGVGDTYLGENTTEALVSG